MPGRKRKSVSSSGSVNVQPVINIPEVDLFYRKELQVQYQNYVIERILPQGNVQEGGEIVFTIRGDPERFLDPYSIRLIIHCQIQNGDGTALGALNVAPVANLGGSMFARVIVTLGNSTQITASHDLYSYLSYLENVFKQSAQFKDATDFTRCIYEDTPRQFDSATDDNLGYKARKSLAEGAGNMYLNVPIVSPITMQNKLLIPQVDVTFTLQPHKPEFMIRSAAPAGQIDQKIVIRNIQMEYRKVRLNTQLHMDIRKGLVHSPAVYPVLFQKIFEFTKLIGIRTIREIIFTERTLPNTVFLLILQTERKIGSYATSPFKIEGPEILSEAKLISGSDVYPSLPYKPELRKINEMYTQTKISLGCFQPGMDNGLNMNSFMGAGGYGLISFDLTRTGKHDTSDIPKIGDLQLHLDFLHPTTINTTYILIMEYDNNIYIRNNLDIVTDFIP